MKFKKVGNKIQVTLTVNEKENTSIYQQLAKLKAKYPAYDVAHAHRTSYGWEIKPK